MPTLDELNERFRHDRFATAVAGARILEAQPSRALCAMPLTPQHMNANNTPMGGAIFTLADFALAICCNIGEEPTVSVDSNISFFRATKGTKLTATATCDKPGRHLGFYTVLVEDDLGKAIAKMTATCYR